jgi:hypothetical protein
MISGSNISLKVDNNNCERLFSLAKLVNPSVRSSMDPDSLEMFLFLKASKDLWENTALIQDVLDRLKAANNGVAEDDDDEEDGEDDEET